jgi:hypothetical protein
MGCVLAISMSLQTWLYSIGYFYLTELDVYRVNLH